MIVNMLCPRCRKSADLTVLNQEIEQGRGMMACSNCGGVAAITAWMVLTKNRATVAGAGRIV